MDIFDSFITDAKLGPILTKKELKLSQIILISFVVELFILISLIGFIDFDDLFSNFDIVFHVFLISDLYFSNVS